MNIKRIPGLEDMTEQKEKRKKDFQKNPYKQQAYFTSRIESEKAILAISSSAIGALVMLLKFMTEISTAQFIIYIIASLCFLVSAITVVLILHYNGGFLIDGSNKELLQVLDKIKMGSFVLGLFAVLALGVVIAFDNLEENPTMTDECYFEQDELKRKGYLLRNIGGEEELPSEEAPSEESAEPEESPMEKRGILDESFSDYPLDPPDDTPEPSDSPQDEEDF